MITQKDKDDLAGRLCTIDGKPATISGRLLEFAVVGSFDRTTKAEFSWEAVKRIMAKNGKFSS